MKLVIVVLCAWVSICLSCADPHPKECKKPKQPDPDSCLSLTCQQQEEVRKFDSLFDYLTKVNTFNGNVLVAEKGKIIYKKSFGVANSKENKRLHDSSLFQLASISKTITAALTLKLVEEGKLNLEEDVSKYLPDFPYKGISIKLLLSHRSGLGNYIYFSESFVADKMKRLTNEEVYKIMVDHKPEIYLEPNKRFNYSNTNYMLLALICERITKTNFKELAKQKIFDVCGMKNTFFADDAQNNKNATIGYTYSMREVGGDIFDFVWGDKGVYTTTSDLFLFEEAYFNGKLINDTLVQSAIQPKNKERRLGNYGFGWRMKDFNSENKLVYHNGWWHGYRTALQRRLKDDICVIILSNRLNSSVYQTQRLFKIIDADTSKVDAADEF